jgi:hypothetical protein
MALLNQPVQVYGQLKNLFDILRQGQAPEKFTREFLKDIGFTSSNHLAFIPLLKGLGFLTSDGAPTQRYRNFLDKTLSGKVLAEAIREAYGDIFVLKARPTRSDRALIEGKFKSTYNLSDLQADRMAPTFLALLELADEQALYSTTSETPTLEQLKPPQPELEESPASIVRHRRSGAAEIVGLHYNIQIHLPPTKDIEVYNAIFKSIREHLLD